MLEIDADSILFGEPVGVADLIPVAPDGQRTTVVADLLVPAGVVIGRDGAIYVSTMGVFPGDGQVIRFTP